MSGLLGDVLPFLYSQGDRAKRYVRGLLEDPAGTLAQAAGQLQDSGRANRGLLNAAIDDKGRMDKGKAAEWANQAITGLLGFAPAGMTKLSKNLDEYVGTHRAPMKGGGDPLHNVSQTVYPDDFYGPNGLRYYGTGVPYDADSYATILAARGRPDKMVTMYRAIPHTPTKEEQIASLERMKDKFMRRGIVPAEFGASRKSLGDGDGFYAWVTNEIDKVKALPDEAVARPSINNGDWVTLSRKYAKDHGESALGGQYKVVSKSVPARKLFTNGDSLHEFGYDQSGFASPEMLALLGIGAVGTAAFLDQR